MIYIFISCICNYLFACHFINLLIINNYLFKFYFHRCKYMYLFFLFLRAKIKEGLDNLRKVRTGGATFMSNAIILV